jgi:hypothetical protein
MLTAADVIRARHPFKVSVIQRLILEAIEQNGPMSWGEIHDKIGFSKDAHSIKYRMLNTGMIHVADKRSRPEGSRGGNKIQYFGLGQYETKSRHQIIQPGKSMLAIVAGVYS